MRLTTKEALLKGKLETIHGFRSVGFGTTAIRTQLPWYYWISAEKNGLFITVQTDHRDILKDRATAIITGELSEKLAQVINRHGAMEECDISLLAYALASVMDDHLASRGRRN